MTTSCETLPDVELAPALHSSAILIVPPIPRPRIDKSRFRATLNDPDVHVVFQMRQTAGRNRNGPVVYNHAVALVPRTSEPYAAPGMLEQLNEIGEEFPTRSFKGFIEATSVEGDGRPWRYAVGTGGVAQLLRPQLVYRWPGEHGVLDLPLTPIAREALASFADPVGVVMSVSEASALHSRPTSSFANVLDRLARHGLLRGEFGDVLTPNGGPRRHDYTITDKGLEWLAVHAA
jgi:hypothetical protein